MSHFRHETLQNVETRRHRLLSELSSSLNSYGVAQDLNAKQVCYDNYRESLSYLRKRFKSSGLQIVEWSLFGSTAPLLRFPILKPLLFHSSRTRWGVYPLEYTHEEVVENVTKNHGNRMLPSDIDLILDVKSKTLSRRDISYAKYFAQKHTFEEFGVFIQFK